MALKRHRPKCNCAREQIEGKNLDGIVHKDDAWMLQKKTVFAADPCGRCWRIHSRHKDSAKDHNNRKIAQNIQYQQPCSLLLLHTTFNKPRHFQTREVSIWQMIRVALVTNHQSIIVQLKRCSFCTTAIVEAFYPQRRICAQHGGDNTDYWVLEVVHKLQKSSTFSSWTCD